MDSSSSKPRRLEEELTASTTPSAAPAIAVGATCALKRFDPLVGKLDTAEGRKLAPEEYKNVCRLLAHHSARHQLRVGNDPLPTDAQLFVREPCGLFRWEILTPLPKLSHASGFLPSFLSNIEAVLREVQIQVSAVYDPNFFSGSFLHAFFTVESWMTSNPMLPANISTTTFHVY
jgi:hypothetical protein